MAEQNVTRRLAAILYADVAGYSRLTGEDEEGTHKTLSAYLDVITAAIEHHRGRVVHFAGDAVLAEFASVVDAVVCALEVQSDLKARNDNLADERKVLVAQVMGRLFMGDYGDPFQAIDQELDGLALGSGADCIIVDIHAEATSEKMAMGHYLDGRVTLVVGSHTQVPSADQQILGGGTAYMTDIGMCGDYDSVIGMKKDGAMARFSKPDSPERLEPAKGEATLCAVVVETDDRTGLAKTIEPLRLGGRLAPAWPRLGGEE